MQRLAAELSPMYATQQPALRRQLGTRGKMTPLKRACGRKEGTANGFAPDEFEEDAPYGRGWGLSEPSYRPRPVEQWCAPQGARKPEFVVSRRARDALTALLESGSASRWLTCRIS